MSRLVFSLAGNLKCTSGQALRQGWKVCCACMLFQLTSWGWKQEQCIFLQPYFTSHGWSCCILCCWCDGLSRFLCAFWQWAVQTWMRKLLQLWPCSSKSSTCRIRLVESGFLFGFWGCCFLFCFFAWTKPTCRSNGILNKLFYLQWQRSNRVWIVLPVLLSLHR